jgi:hypothetical protein
VNILYVRLFNAKFRDEKLALSSIIYMALLEKKTPCDKLLEFYVT